MAEWTTSRSFALVGAAAPNDCWNGSKIGEVAVSGFRVRL